MSLLGPDRMLVGREVVDRKDAKCISCHQPFKAGEKGAPGVNLYSKDGLREIGISGMCEACFDGLFEDDDVEEDYALTCMCDWSDRLATKDEEVRNACALCGKKIA